jgi:hypothetical protein
MKAANMSMGVRAWRARLSLTLLTAVLTALAAGTATAQVAPPHRAPSPKVVSKAHQPVGTPHKASSFAPHPTKRRVFGAPIQAPILSNVKTKKTEPK